MEHPHNIPLLRATHLILDGKVRVWMHPVLECVHKRCKEASFTLENLTIRSGEALDSFTLGLILYVKIPGGHEVSLSFKSCYPRPEIIVEEAPDYPGKIFQRIPLESFNEQTAPDLLGAFLNKYGFNFRQPT